MEWEGDNAEQLEDLCVAPGTSYKSGACDTDGAVGVCEFPENQGIVVRNVYFMEADLAQQACEQAGASWTAL